MTFSPEVQMMTQEPWFREAVEHLNRAVALLMQNGVRGGAQINVLGATLHVR